MENPKRKRIIFLDMMRAFAVLMMVQGHTIDAFLGDSYRNFDSVPFNIWFMMRGFTAPIFMFTSGVVFTYLLRLNKETFFYNPRVKKGFMRFLTLIVIGYLLRYPTYTFFNFATVSREQWYVFFTVDALHLIGFGLLFILILAFIAERLKIKDWVIFGCGALFFFMIAPYMGSINWTNYLPVPFAAYFYNGTGSFFPFFPWAGYVISGAILGSYLAHHQDSLATKGFSLKLLYTGLGMLLLALATELIEYFYTGTTIWTDNLYLISLRVGWVLVLNSIMSLIALKLDSIPEIVKQVGRHTLLIYAVHVVIIYGSAWLPGFDRILHKQLSIFESVGSAIIMIILMIGMVVFLERMKLIRKNKLAQVEI